jgi:rhodanese-related sulfurtransferase
MTFNGFKRKQSVDDVHRVRRVHLPERRRSAMAATAARRAGLDAHNVSGGMTAWEQQGLDTSTPGRTR